VGAVLRQAARICSSDADAKSIAMTVEIQEGNYVLGDASRLQQVFWNLLNNAVKFTPADGRITVRCSTGDGQRVVVSVSDTGIGVDPPALTRIFDAFEQQDRGVTRQFGGLGLGLAICKAIVERHGGAIRASSLGRNKGTTMWVELPQLIDVEAPPRGGPPSATLTPPLERKLRLLLVEDHADTSRIMSQLLRKCGHTVTTADCVAAALKAADEGGYDLIISDLGLPDGSGLELMRDLHGRLGLKGIALSGYGMEEDVRKSVEAGFAEHLTKPINMRRLNQVVQAVAAS
jgi:two-component system CheB/CheR fusion protein